MKRYLIIVVLAVMLPVCAIAQSSMTDEQVMEFVVKENSSGTSQAQIVTKLMQRGVDISQIRRVRQKYERMADGGGLGQVNTNELGKSGSRLRTNNGKKRKKNRSGMMDDDEYMSDEDVHMI